MTLRKVQAAGASLRAPNAQQELDEALAHGPFSRALTLAVEASGLSLQRLQHRLAQVGVHVSTTTLSYWKTGRSRPERPDSLRGVRVLEDVLGLPRGALRDLLGPRRPRGRWVAPASGSVRMEQMWDRPGVVGPLMQWLQAPPINPLRRLSLHESLHLGPDRTQRQLRVREVVRAEEDRISRTFVVFRGDTPGRPPAISSTRYCRLGRVRCDQERSFTVAELALDRVLAEGDTTILEYEVDLGDVEPDNVYHRAFQLPTHQYVIEVHFAEEAVPARCYSSRMDTPAGREEDLREAWISSANIAHAAHIDLAPGLYRMHWDWG
ncbi:hypothetical protein F0L68_32550 [Solihabitans fulvus]|uniref:Uncharacterized protein n=1 Tax=Solihabitans fulvus TaxID=1892852 RepID=A0A5B2WS77_9PSEU|nr:hypothetical protein [Solihabitans fulvus]KAA2253542.1 hypothetical protein F0L68_32550 [Solihabitans fulvus]